MHLCIAGTSDYVVEKVLNLAQATATYDAAVAVGDVMITGYTFYVLTAAGGGFTSVAVQTNQTTALVMMTAVEGAAANLLAQSHPTVANDKTYKPWTLRSGQKIQYSIIAAGGPTGEMRLILNYRPISIGASL